MFCPADIQYKTNQVRARRGAPLRIAVGRLKTTPLLHICASLRHRRARPQPRSTLRTPSRRRHRVVVADGVGPPATGSGPTRAVGHAVAALPRQQAVVSQAHPSEESGLRTLPRRNLPLRSSFKLAIASVSRTWPCRNLPLRRRSNFKFVIASVSSS